MGVLDFFLELLVVFLVDGFVVELVVFVFASAFSVVFVVTESLTTFDTFMADESFKAGKILAKDNSFFDDLDSEFTG